jgi:hypothetical protein
MPPSPSAAGSGCSGSSAPRIEARRSRSARRRSCSRLSWSGPRDRSYGVALGLHLRPPGDLVESRVEPQGSRREVAVALGTERKVRADDASMLALSGVRAPCRAGAATTAVRPFQRSRKSPTPHPLHPNARVRGGRRTSTVQEKPMRREGCGSAKHERAASRRSPIARLRRFARATAAVHERSPADYAGEQAMLAQRRSTEAGHQASAPSLGPAASPAGESPRPAG